MNDSEFEQAIEAIERRQGAAEPAERSQLVRAKERASKIVGLCGGREMRFDFQTGYYAPLPVGTRGPEPRYARYRIESGELLDKSGLPVDSSPDIAAEFLRDCDALLRDVERQLDEYRKSGGV
jgi:hypothetical protein